MYIYIYTYIYIYIYMYRERERTFYMFECSYILIHMALTLKTIQSNVWYLTIVN